MPNFCPVSDRFQTCSECSQVEEQWHTNKLLSDLAQYNEKRLSDTEKCHLFLLLYGLSPSEIIKHLNYSPNSSSVLSRVYAHVTPLTKKKVKNWAQVRLHLEQKQYRKQYTGQSVDNLEIRILISGNLGQESASHILKKLRDKLDELEQE